MRNLASFMFVLLLCSCSRLHGSPEQRQITGTLLIHPSGGSADYGWDERGQPIALVPANNDQVAHELDALAPSDQECFGALYEATYVIRDPKEFRGARVPIARLVNVVRARVATRPDPELQRLLHKFDVRVACPACAPVAPSAPEWQVKRVGTHRCAVL